MRHFWTGTALFLTVLGCDAARASEFPHIDRLMFRAFAREARQKAFLASLALGEAQSKVRRLKQRVDRLDALRASKAATEAEYASALMELIEQKFAEERARFHLTELKERESLWKLRSELATETPQSRRAIAEGITRLYAARTKLLEELDRNLEPYLNLVNADYDRAKRLVARNAISREEFEQVEAVKNDADGLAELARRELTQSRIEVDEAEADVRSLPVGNP